MLFVEFFVENDNVINKSLKAKDQETRTNSGGFPIVIA